MGPKTDVDFSKDKEFCMTTGHQTPDRPASSIFILLIEINELLFICVHVIQLLIHGLYLLG